MHGYRDIFAGLLQVGIYNAVCINQVIQEGTTMEMLWFQTLSPGAGVAIDRYRKHRSLYTGNATESELMLNGICTDALSHINCKIKEQIQYI